MTANTKLRIISPTGLSLEAEVSSAYFYSSEGQIGILSNHAAYTGLVSTGLLELTSAADGTTQRVVLGDGICEIQNNTLVILADTVDFANSLELSVIEKEKQNLLEEQKNLSKETTIEERNLIAKRIKRIETYQKLMSN